MASSSSTVRCVVTHRDRIGGIQIPQHWIQSTVLFRVSLSGHSVCFVVYGFMYSFNINTTYTTLYIYISNNMKNTVITLVWTLIDVNIQYYIYSTVQYSIQHSQVWVIEKHIKNEMTMNTCYCDTDEWQCICIRTSIIDAHTDIYLLIFNDYTVQYTRVE